MTESGPSRSGAAAYVCAAVFFAVIAIASVAWVLAAPSASDDQGTRATFAGWALGILALLLTVAAAALGLKRKSSSSAVAAVANSGDVLGGQQNIGPEKGDAAGIRVRIGGDVKDSAVTIGHNNRIRRMSFRGRRK
jgi:hypothetical protein